MNSWGLLVIGIGLPVAFAAGNSFGDGRARDEMTSSVRVETVYSPSPNEGVCKQMLELAWEYADPADFAPLDDSKTYDPGE